MNHKKTNSIQQNSKLHFKQWRNKGYAAFCSMGKVVHIGNLAISLTQWIGNIIEHIEDIINLSIDREVDESAEELLEQELLQVVPALCNASNGCAISILSKFKILTAVNWRISPVNGFFCLLW